MLLSCLMSQFFFSDSYLSFLEPSGIYIINNVILPFSCLRSSFFTSKYQFYYFVLVSYLELMEWVEFHKLHHGCINNGGYHNCSASILVAFLQVPAAKWLT